MKKSKVEDVRLEKIVGGGQAIGQMADGRKVFVWGGLPGELVKLQVTKAKRNLVQAMTLEVLEASEDRVEPLDKDSYISTSPWQIMNFEAEQEYKLQLIKEAFELHHIDLRQVGGMQTDGRTSRYRNKVEFSWYWDNENERLELAFFRRGTQGKIPVESMSLIPDHMMGLALQVRNILRKRGTQARDLKSLMIRSDQNDRAVFQLYVKVPKFSEFSPDEIIDAQGYQIIHSNPLSPASVITKILHSGGDNTLTDTILGTPFSYACDGFFQVNIPVYEMALNDMKKWIPVNSKVLDLYSGVGSIGLTIGGGQVTLVESNDTAVREMERNIKLLKKRAEIIHATAEKSLGYIGPDACIIVDPPRAGLHQDVIDRLLEALPERIIYLSCNPVTQARDFALLQQEYSIVYQQGYNFFPRTPHIENLLVIERR